jgi:5-methylcytosine-specific restriction endonuclease McrA
MFTQAQRTVIFNRCGNRCESKRWFWSRCRSKPTHADHIYPWSKGGATSLANAQGLCARHNLMKSNHIPSDLYLRSLERRRKAYFPNGMPTAVVWQIGGR